VHRPQALEHILSVGITHRSFDSGVSNEFLHALAALPTILFGQQPGCSPRTFSMLNATSLRSIWGVVVNLAFYNWTLDRGE
jgi:hypothetical protein